MFLIVQIPCHCLSFTFLIIQEVDGFSGQYFVFL